MLENSPDYASALHLEFLFSSISCFSFVHFRISKGQKIEPMIKAFPNEALIPVTQMVPSPYSDTSKEKPWLISSEGLLHHYFICILLMNFLAFSIKYKCYFYNMRWKIVIHLRCIFVLKLLQILVVFLPVHFGEQNIDFQ